LAQGLRARIDGLLPEKLGAFTHRAAALREVAAAQVPAGPARRAFWHDFFFGSVAEAGKSGDEVAYELALGDSLFAHSHGVAGRLSVLIPPSDVELLTLKAQRRLLEADVIVADGKAHAPLLEMARRDAVRSGNEADALAQAMQGRNVVVVAQRANDLLQRAGESGISAELLNHGPLSTQSPFPVREDLQDAILRAAS
jgi:hypothetical protein